MSALRLKVRQFNLRRSVATYPIRKEMVHGHSEGASLGPIPNPSSPSASLPLLWYESPRKRKYCALFSPRVPRPAVRLGRPPMEAAFLRSGNQTPRFRTQDRGYANRHGRHFGSEIMGIHLTSVGNVLFILPNCRSRRWVLRRAWFGVTADFIGGSSLVGALFAATARHCRR